MTTIKRGTIKDYDAGTHRAAVQVTGSLATYLPAVPVSAGIPASAVVAGRDCGVVFFTDDDPADAAVVTVHNATPPAVAGPAIADADGDTRWDTEASPDEDKLRGTVAGTLRTLVQATSPHHDLTGDLRLSGTAAVDGASPNTRAGINILGGATRTGYVGVHIGIGSTAIPTADGQVTGLGGYALARTSGDTHARGLNYFAGMQNIDLANAYAIETHGFLSGSGKTLTDFFHHRRNGPITNVFATLTNYIGDYWIDPGTGTNRRHIHARDMNAGTISRFLEFENALVVKCSGEYTAAANQTPVFIYEGTTPTLRQVQWKDGAAIGAGDRVMVLV